LKIYTIPYKLNAYKDVLISLLNLPSDKFFIRNRNYFWTQF